MISRMVRSVSAMPGMLTRPMFRMASSGVAPQMPSVAWRTTPSMARQAHIRAALEAVASFSAQPIFPPSQIIPVRFPLILMMVPPICSSVPPISQTMAAEAAVAAETPQPQVADSFPVKSLM